MLLNGAEIIDYNRVHVSVVSFRFLYTFHVREQRNILSCTVYTTQRRRHLAKFRNLISSVKWIWYQSSERKDIFSSR